MSKFKIGDKVEIVKVPVSMFTSYKGLKGEVTEAVSDFITVELLNGEEITWLDDKFELIYKEKKLPDNVPTILDGGGKRFNDNKPRTELLIPEAMEAEARVWAMGAKKYGDYNWQKGMSWTVVLGCILRHTFAIMIGEDIDKESGELHAAHIKCNATMLIYYYLYYKKGDDRIKRLNKE